MSGYRAIAKKIGRVSRIPAFNLATGNLSNGNLVSNRNLMSNSNRAACADWGRKNKAGEKKERKINEANRAKGPWLPEEKYLAGACLYP